MRLTKILFVALLIFILSLSLFSCATEHEHTYSSEWTVTESEHYKAPLCVCNADPKDKGEHVDEDNNGLCDECEYDFGHTHTYGEEWIITTSEHYRKASCGHDIPYINKSSHKDTDNNGLCDTCSYDYGHTHTYSVSWTATTTEHYKAPSCSHDVAPIDKGAHVDANNDGVCDTCSYDYGHTHTYSGEWTKTDTEHYKNATCGHNAYTDKGAHTDSDNNGLCDTCSYDYGHTHTYSVSWTVTATEHYKAPSCSHDVAPIDKGAHVDANNDGVCDTCSYDYGHTHTYSGEWTKTDTEHYKAVTCGHSVAPKDRAGHIDSENDGVCDTCSYGSDHTHTYSNEWAKTDTEHYKAVTCGHSVAPKDRSCHTDTDKNKECDTCGYDYNHTHAYFDVLSHDELGNHFYLPSCGCSIPAKDTQPHTDTDGDCECDLCFAPVHKPSGEWTKTADGHYKAYDCDNPLHITEAGEHTDGDGDCLCDTCLHVMHTYSDEWTTTDKEHYHKASCDKDEHATDVGKHEDTDGDCLCDVCHLSLHKLSGEWTKTADGHYKAYDCENPLHITEAGEHTDENGDCLCDECDYVMHTYSDEWTITDKEHYHKASCDKDEHATDVGKHEYTDDHKCDECGKKSYNLPSVGW